MVDFVKVFKSAFGAAATGFSLSAGVDAVLVNIVNPARAGLIAGGLAIIFAVKEAVIQKLEEAKAKVEAYNAVPEDPSPFDENYNAGEPGFKG